MITITHGFAKNQVAGYCRFIASKVHVVSKSKIDTVIPIVRPTQQAQVQELTITAFDSGYYAIPPFQFVVNGDTAHPLMTEALMLQVVPYL